MSEIMRPIAFEDLIFWALEEYKNEGSIFGIPKDKFYKNTRGQSLKTVFGDEISSAVGPAAGPQSQLAQNLVAAYLTGARFMEVKTVQIMDGEEIQAAVNRPCIFAQDEAYNCEWSTELTVQEAYEEYIKAYFAIIFLAKELGLADKKDFAYNMSVGYDLAGIKSEKVDGYIEGMRDGSDREIFKACYKHLEEQLGSFKNFKREDLENISPKICDSITLSTLHGCPAHEIEAIAQYLLEEKKMSTFIKCNPTILGYDYARKTLDSMGYDYIAFTDFHFNNDLQYEDGVAMFKRLLEVAKANDLAFGLKLSNTFPVDVKRKELPSEEMYMSGRSLLPLTLSMAAKLSAEFNGKLPMSYSGGADGLNIREIFEALGQPITVATTILKPGGYPRFNQLAQETEDLLARSYTGVDVEKITALKDRVIADWTYNKLSRSKVGSRKTDSDLPLTDCFKAPCKDGGCPIHQQIPEYLKLVGEGRYEEAIKVIIEDNPAPTILGKICAHHCQDHCTRVDYEKTLQIREMKLIAADMAQDAYVDKITAKPLRSDKKVLVVGAGPGGIGTATYLRRNGLAVSVYEKLAEPYGMVSHIIPAFRISKEEINRDYKIALNEGVDFHFNREVKESLEDLKKDFDYIVLATGAWESGRCPVSEGGENIVDALDFLWETKMGSGMDLGKKVAVIGAGDVAMDCTRLAARQAGVEEVSLVYRRTEAYMPATQEEVNDVKAEGHKIYELLAPISYDGSLLKCEKMTLGDFDQSGRRAVCPTGDFVDLEFDTVIGATGARVSRTYEKANGLNIDDRGRLKLLASLESSVENVYFVGDCKAGPATIVKALGDGKTVALDILRKEGLDADFEKFSYPEDPDLLGARVGVLENPRPGHEEGLRCLKCDQVCQICSQVCPNRANVTISVPAYRDIHQILHIDGMCNECGNCGIFCPHKGDPYKDKITLFWTEADFVDSTNTGFLKTGPTSYKVRQENGNIVAGNLEDLDLSRDLVAFIKAVEDRYSYYLRPSK